MAAQNLGFVFCDDLGQIQNKKLNKHNELKEDKHLLNQLVSNMFAFTFVLYGSPLLILFLNILLLILLVGAVRYATAHGTCNAICRPLSPVKFGS